MSETVPTPVPALGMSLSVDIAPGANVVFQTHLDRECLVEDIDDLLGKAMTAANRQRAAFEALKCCVEIRDARRMLKENLRKLAELQAGTAARLALASANRRNEQKPTTQQIAAENSHRENIDALRVDLARKERRLDMLRAIVRGDKGYDDLALSELDELRPEAAAA